jgi:hypothetical protein
MKEPNYDLILKSKIEHYGETKAAYELAAEEFTRQKVKYCNLFGVSGSLLERYIEHVVRHEGSNFISKIHQYSDDVHFTDDEIKILKALAGEQ